MLSNQLMYLLYGGKTVYRQEAKFSILSALRYRKDPSSFSITVMTDQPDDFQGWPVNVIGLDEDTLKSWVGSNGYHHRQKACAIQAGAKLAEKTIFIDTDTVFLKDPAALFKRVKDDQFLVDEFEWTWAAGSLRPAYHAFAKDLASKQNSPPQSMKLYNSGVCGLTSKNGAILDESIKLIDQWAHHCGRLQTIEQIALSFMLDGKKVVEAKDCVNHYYSVKHYHHAMIGHFFEKHGEQFQESLPALTATVPSVVPKNSIQDRLKLKLKFRKESPELRKIAKLYFLGKNANRCEYLQACRPLWWGKVITEMRALPYNKSTERKLNSLWDFDQEFKMFVVSQVRQAA